MDYKLHSANYKLIIQMIIQWTLNPIANGQFKKEIKTDFQE